MDYGLGFLGQYITAAELVGKTPTLTIAKIVLEKVESLKNDDDSPTKMRDRLIIYFKEGKDGRGWLLNRSNAEALKEMWGRETNAWLGKRVTLHTQQVRVGAKVEPGIRVKGSPDIKQAHTFQLKLPRRKPVPYTLLPTGSGAAESVDTTTGEVTEPLPTSDLLPRIAACKTVAEVEALRPKVAKLPKGSHERQIAVETAKAMIEELTPRPVAEVVNRRPVDASAPAEVKDAMDGITAMQDDVI